MSNGNLHALAKARADCAERVKTLGDAQCSTDAAKRMADQAEYVAALDAYQKAEAAYQRAIGTLTNHELIELGLAP